MFFFKVSNAKRKPETGCFNPLLGGCHVIWIRTFLGCTCVPTLVTQVLVVYKELEETNFAYYDKICVL